MNIGGRLISSRIVSSEQLVEVLLNSCILVHSNSDIQSLADVCAGLGIDGVADMRGTTGLEKWHDKIDISRDNEVICYRVGSRIVIAWTSVSDRYRIDIDELLPHMNRCSRAIQWLRWRLHRYR